jgi:hypothetical protein
VAEHGDLHVLLVGRRAEPKETQDPPNEQQSKPAAHADDPAGLA